MISTAPLETVMKFITCINTGDMPGLYEAMTEDHIFQDALGKRFIGRDTVSKGWETYLKMIENYKLRAEEFLEDGQVVGFFGVASGSYTQGGKSLVDGFWEVPAAWRAVVRDGQIAEWRVYADNQPVRKLMGERQP